MEDQTKIRQMRYTHIHDSDSRKEPVDGLFFSITVGNFHLSWTIVTV